MAINVDSVLNNIGKYKSSGTSNNNRNTQISSLAWQKANQMVSEYKAIQEQKGNESDSGSKNIFGNLSFSQVANMSTKDFVNYAYDNKASSGYTSQSEDSSGVKLPMIVRYKGEIVTTAGKSFMAVVAKFSAKFPNRSEEEIAAELLQKYAGDTLTANNTQNQMGTTSSQLGGTLNMFG